MCNINSVRHKVEIFFYIPNFIVLYVMYFHDNGHMYSKREYLTNLHFCNICQIYMIYVDEIIQYNINSIQLASLET